MKKALTLALFILLVLCTLLVAACSKKNPDADENKVSAYQIYKNTHPDYPGDEATWLDDLAHDRLGSEKTYSLSFDTAGGAAIAPITYTAGQAIGTVPTPERAGYEFTGWKLYEYDLIPIYPVTENLTLTATWEAVKYRITYYLGGGINAKENPLVYTVESGALALAAPSYNGSEFLGWTWNGETVTEIPAGSTGDITLCADWNFIHYELLEDGTYGVAGFYVPQSELIVPSTYRGAPVTVILNGAFRNTSLAKELNVLRRVVLADSVKKIGEEAFMYCNGLNSITLGAGLTEIQNHAFFACNHLAEVINKSELDLQHPYDSWSYGSLPSYIVVLKTDGESGIYREGDYLFLTHEDTHWLITYEGSDTELQLPEWQEKTYRIARWAFFGNKSITQITLPDCVTEIGEFAFGYCEALKGVVLPKSMQSFSLDLFYGCYQLKWVLARENLTGFSCNGIDDCGLEIIFFRGTEEQWANVAKENFGNIKVYFYSEQEKSGEKYWHFDTNGTPTVW